MWAVILKRIYKNWINEYACKVLEINSSFKHNIYIGEDEERPRAYSEFQTQNWNGEEVLSKRRYYIEKPRWRREEQCSELENPRDNKWNKENSPMKRIWEYGHHKNIFQKLIKRVKELILYFIDDTGWRISSKANIVCQFLLHYLYNNK